MLDPLFFNLETNLILYLYPEKWIKFNQSELRFRNSEMENLKFCPPFKITIPKRKELSNFENRFFIFLYYI